MDNEDYHTFESSLSKEGLIYMDVAASGVKRYINILQKKGYKDYKDVYKLLLFINLYEIFYEPFVNGTPDSPKEAELHFGNMFYKGQQNDITYVNRVKGYGFNDKNSTELYSYLNDDDIIAIGKMMSCLMGSTCLLPLPTTYMNN